MTIRTRFACWVRRLFSRARTPLSPRDTLQSDLDRRQRVRDQQPISAACRANGLTAAERAQVFDHFQRIGRIAGLGEARSQAVNLAAQIARKRQRISSTVDPWQPPHAA